MGRSFQAKIPFLQEKNLSHADSHNALQLWSAWEELDLPVNQQRGSVTFTHTHTHIYWMDLHSYRPVEALLLMARSSVVPAGGTSMESALHTLTQCRGDFVVRTRRCCCCCCLSPNENELRFGCFFQLTLEKLLSPPETSSGLTDQQYKRTHSPLLRIISEHNRSW